MRSKSDIRRSTEWLRMTPLIVSAKECDPSNKATIFGSILNSFNASNFQADCFIYKMWLVPKTNTTCQGKLLSIITI